MTLALIHRELLTQGRRPATYWFRVAVAGVGLAGLAWICGFQWIAAAVGRPAMSPSEFTGWALGILHGCLTVVLGLGGALLTADCIARERREGTLGLLFLTPLSPGDVVVGKCAGQALRLGAVWLCMVPLLLLPLLLGGVTLRNMADALLAQIAAALTGVAAGLLATAYCRSWGWSMFSSAAWLLFFYVSHVAVSALALFVNYVVLKSGSIDGYALMALPVMPLLIGIGLPLEGPLGAGAGAGPGGMIFMSRLMLGLMTVWSALLFTTAFLLLYGVLARTREEGPVGARSGGPESSPKDTHSVSTPLALGTGLAGQKLYRPRFPSPRLGRNPYYWLETRPALFRQGRWLLVFAVASVWLLAGVRDFHVDWLAFAWYALPVLLGIGAVFLAAASFRREYEEGGWELLQSTPLAPSQILWGRLGAMGRVIWPVTLALLFLGWFREGGDDRWYFASYFAVVSSNSMAAASVAFLGAARRLHPLAAVGIALAVGVVLPFALCQVGRVLLNGLGVRAPVPIRGWLSWDVAGLQLAMVPAFVGWAYRRLKLRVASP